MAHSNVLLITADHIRWDALGCNGNGFVKTPNIDRLASEGLSFKNSFTPDPICVPARASITTGNYPHKCTGRKSNTGLIKDDQVKIAEHFNSFGYKTYALGKLHYVPYSPPDEKRLLHGFQHAELCEEGRILKQFSPDAHTPGLEDYHDYLYSVGYGGYERAHGIGNNDIHPAPSPVPAEHYVDRWIANRTIAKIKEHVSEQDGPFFTWMSFPKPHSPYDPPHPYNRMYDPRDIEEPIGCREADPIEKRSPVLKMTRDSHGFGYLSPQAVQVARAHYYGMISFQDECIGSVIECLEEEGVKDDTIIIYTGDHGDLLGDFGCFFKANFLNGSVKIPSVWSLPDGISKKNRDEAIIGLQDILPTLSALTGTPLEKEVQGTDLSPVFRGDTKTTRESYIGQCLDENTHQQQYMLFTGRYKYIYCEMNGTEELYDLYEDPDELHNCVERERERADEMRCEIIEWCKNNGDEDMLENGDLKRTDVEPKDKYEFRAGSMGWRWY